MEKLPSAKELFQMYDSGMSSKEIAEKLGANSSSVRAKMLRAGYELRSLSEAHSLMYKTGRHENTGKSGEEHYMWKDGKSRRGYRKVVEKKECDTCGSKEKLCIHHKDLDHYNDDPSNLQVLCSSCHMRIHKKAFWDAKRSGEDTPKSNGPVGWERGKS